MFAVASADTWIERLDAAGVPAGPINEIADVFADPHVRHRGMKVELQHEQLGDLPGVASPIMIDGKRAVASSAPPMLGENTDEILARDLGLNSGQIAAVRARGIVG